jgi:RNase P subunit RPR2
MGGKGSGRHPSKSFSAIKIIRIKVLTCRECGRVFMNGESAVSKIKKTNYVYYCVECATRLNLI